MLNGPIFRRAFWLLCVCCCLIELVLVVFLKNIKETLTGFENLGD